MTIDARKEVVARVIATPEANNLILRLVSQYGEIIFHQSGGCCDGSSPMCFQKSDFLTGDQDVFLGQISEAAFYISAAQFAYWRHTQLIIDVVPGRGGMFSLENGTGERFLTRSRVFSQEELSALQEI